MTDQLLSIGDEPTSLEKVVRSWFDAVEDKPAALRSWIIGEGRTIEGPFGPKRLIYADYAASGRALLPIEQFILEEVLPFYANPHTQASHCGEVINRLRAEARHAIAKCFRATPDHEVIFTGSGATAGLNILARLLVPKDCKEFRPLVLLGPYEHHSNILPWRESGAEVIELGEGRSGGPDLSELEAILQKATSPRKVIASFSAASNVTGVVADVETITKLLKAHGAISIWDYAGGAPYLPIDLSTNAMDALVVSPHKFLGGPGASGLLVVRNSNFRTSAPSSPGGGTVSFVSPWGHRYLDSLSAREEAGTPNAIGDIRAALAILIKSNIGHGVIEERESALNDRVLSAWHGHDQIELLGNLDAPRIPIFSFRIRDGHGASIHHQLVTRMLSDLHGVQARGGCACAGPYAHRLLAIDRQQSESLQLRLEQGHELDKPGWTRVNFSYAMNDSDANAIIGSVLDIAERASSLSSLYIGDATYARFRYRS